MEPIMVRPGRFCQGRRTYQRFCLVVDESMANEFAVERAGPYNSYELVGLTDANALDRLLDSVDLDETEVLVVSRDGLSRRLSSRHVNAGGGLAVVACDTTPITTEQIGYLLSSLERCASPRQAELADRLRDALWSSGNVSIASGATSTVAILSLEPDWLWIRDAFGTRRRPSVTLSVSPEPSTPSAVEIYRGDAAARLPLSGQITVKGRPIVRTLGRRSIADQAVLYESLLVTVGTPFVLEVDDGLIGQVRAVDESGAPALRTLTGLLDADSRHREITQVGVGLDIEMQPLAGNCEANRAYGGQNGRLYVVLGALGSSGFEVILPAETSSLITEDGTVLAGQEPKAAQSQPRRRLNRVNSPSCGCH
jgi:hypothetical protein